MKPAIAPLVAFLACVAAPLAHSDTVSTMRGSDAASADQAPAQHAYVGGRPGNQKPVARSFKGQPPLIPHAIADYEITPAENACLECHISDEFKGKKMPKVSPAHLVAAKLDADGNPVLDMTHWQCDTCHVAQVDAKPLVENRFRGQLPARSAASRGAK